MANYLQIVDTFYGNPDVDTPPSATGKAGFTRIDKDTQGYVTSYTSDGTNWIAHDDGGVFSFRRKGTTENRWYVAGHIANTALTGVNITANLIYAMPFIVPRSGLTISDMAVNVTVGVASTTAKLGIYKDNGNVAPGALFHYAGSVATDTSGTFQIVDITPDKFMKGGLYWFAIACNGAPGIRFVNTPSQLNIMGFNTTPATTLGAAGYFKSASYPAGDMVDPFPSSPSVNDAAQVPAVYARFV